MTIWTFDSSIADKFQYEASTNIPDYEKVIHLCMLYASAYSKESYAIDVGSALGHTVDIFTSAGFINMYGVESSHYMIQKSKHIGRIIHNNVLPNNFIWDIVLMNWTLHFIRDKYKYLIDIYNGLHSEGIFILTDKTLQSNIVKDRYYQFKLNNGVSKEYILEKESRLLNSIYLNDVRWYINTLYEIGFQSVEIINARYGFVTFLCKK